MGLTIGLGVGLILTAGVVTAVLLAKGEQDPARPDEPTTVAAATGSPTTSSASSASTAAAATGAAGSASNTGMASSPRPDAATTTGGSTSPPPASAPDAAVKTTAEPTTAPHAQPPVQPATEPATATPLSSGADAKGPTPQRPWVVVAKSPALTPAGRQIADRYAARVKAAGFPRVAVLDGRRFPNFRCCFWVVIVDAFPTRAEAAAEAQEFRAAGFRAYVKHAFKGRFVRKRE